MHAWIITTHMPGYLPNGDSAEPFDATLDDAIAALVDEAEYQLDEWDDEDEVLASDYALVQSYRGMEGRGDLRFTLERTGEASIYLESYANWFGGIVTLRRCAD